MTDGNEKAPSYPQLEAKRKRSQKHESAPEPYHIGSGTATTARDEPSLDGRSSHADLESRPAVTGPRHRSHSAVLIAMAARIARGGRP
jgi:hypothetical protein